MGSIDDFSQLCRLCLVKDQVNIPIFDETSDIGQTFLKINSCLPVKVSRDDNLPKKICDGCSYKLDMLYIFRNTSVDSEKQLISWLNQAGLSTISQTAMKDPLANTKSEIMVKQETFDATDSRIDGDHGDIGVDPQSYLMQQQQLAYQQDFDFGEPSGSNTELTDEPAPKRAKRAAALKKAPIDETDDVEDDLDAAMQITKAEEEDSEDIDQPDYVEPSTSADDQPGPSGVGKASVEAPLEVDEEEDINYLCTVCAQQFSDYSQFLAHQTHGDGQRFICCKCNSIFDNTEDFYAHQEEHSFLCDDDNGTVEETVLDCEDQQEIPDASELLYVLDDLQCDNEVVIQEDVTTIQAKTKKIVTSTILQLEHTYANSKEEEKDEEEEEEEEDTVFNGKQKTAHSSTSQSRPRAPPSKRRRVAPDFSVANCLFVNPNETVNIPHYKCLRCEQLFINRFIFSKHIEKGKCYVNSCDVCSATFEKNSDFYDHYTVTHTDKAICNFCFRTFVCEKNVKEHMMRHLDQFRHRCDECNKGFYTVREYKNHCMRIHIGIRHKCNVCDRSFTDKYYFRRHMATHEQGVIAIE